jgi:hypothetical protein
MTFTPEQVGSASPGNPWDCSLAPPHVSFGLSGWSSLFLLALYPLNTHVLYLFSG